jgi:hypothetical protein
MGLGLALERVFVVVGAVGRVRVSFGFSSAEQQSLLWREPVGMDDASHGTVMI